MHAWASSHKTCRKLQILKTEVYFYRWILDFFKRFLVAVNISCKFFERRALFFRQTLRSSWFRVGRKATAPFSLDVRRTKRASDNLGCFKGGRQTMVQCMQKCGKAGFQTIAVFQTAPNEIQKCTKAWFQAISVFQTAPNSVFFEHVFVPNVS